MRCIDQGQMQRTGITLKPKEAALIASRLHPTNSISLSHDD